MNCNKCGKELDHRYPHHNRDVTAIWGYYSCGKDTLEDRWTICFDCYNNLGRIAEPICSICKHKITDVMSALHVRYRKVSSDAERQREFKRYKTHIEGDFPTGCWEYATCGPITFCEVCYENYTRDFKVPMKVRCYSSPDYTVPTQEFRNRLNNDPNLPKNRKKNK